MSNETEFVDGLIVKAPRDGAPEYVKASLSIKRLELIAWLTARNDEWVNVQIKEARSGKWYAAVDPWKPNAERGQRSTAPQRGGASGGRGAAQTQRRTQQDVDPDPFNDDGGDDIPFATNRSRW